MLWEIIAISHYHVSSVPQIHLNILIHCSPPSRWLRKRDVFMNVFFPSFMSSLINMKKLWLSLIATFVLTLRFSSSLWAFFHNKSVDKKKKKNEKYLRFWFDKIQSAFLLKCLPLYPFYLLSKLFHNQYTSHKVYYEKQKNWRRWRRWEQKNVESLKNTAETTWFCIK